jgi:hypothetical protein
MQRFLFARPNKIKATFLNDGGGVKSEKRDVAQLLTVSK